MVEEKVKTENKKEVSDENILNRMRNLFTINSTKTFQSRTNLLTLDDAVRYVEEKMYFLAETEPELTTKWEGIIRRAKSRDQEAKDQAIEIAKEILGESEVPGYSKEDIAYYCYRELWGLMDLEEVFCDNEVDEIRVDDPDTIQVVRKAKSETCKTSLKDQERLFKLVTRLPLHDNVRITDSQPRLESVLLDGTRLTATKPPLTPQGITFVLRKHGTFLSSKEGYIERQTMDSLTYDFLALCAKCQLNTLIIGPANTGKTTLIREMTKHFDPRLRVIVMESDSELKLRECHSHERRSIIEFEEQPQLDLANKNIFPIVLRYSPNITILGEIRTVEELEESINAAVRGHSGCIASVHYLTIEDAIFHLGMMLVQSGRNLTSLQAQQLVSRAWDIGVLMFESSIHGVKKVLKICEVMHVTDESRPVDLNPLIEWKSAGEDFWTGSWVTVNKPSKRLLDKMKMYGLTQADMEKVGW